MTMLVVLPAAALEIVRFLRRQWVWCGVMSGPVRHRVFGIVQQDAKFLEDTDVSNADIRNIRHGGGGGGGLL